MEDVDDSQRKKSVNFSQDEKNVSAPAPCSSYDRIARVPGSASWVPDGDLA